MNKIFWAFGGTCVGKKHFIAAAAEDPSRFGLPEGLQVAWYLDGDMEPHHLVSLAEAAPIIVRWQWGREIALAGIATQRPDIQQAIFLCKVNPSVQVARVLAREGSPKFDERNLIREAEDVQFTVERLSMAHQIPVTYIDASKEY